MEHDGKDITTHSLLTARRHARTLYFSIGAVDCPTLHPHRVMFNRKGWDHLLYKPSRSKEELIERLYCLRHASMMLRDAATATEFREVLSGSTTIGFWMFRARVGPKMTLKLIVRRLGSGAYHFYSIMRER
jgi:hypothetical protein